MNKSTGTARDKPLPGGWTALLNYLAALPPGPVADTAVERLLAACWDELSGDAGGVKPYKLLGRTEDVTWTPPKLTFAIERHGGTVLGSSRAELQRRTVDVAQRTATHGRAGHRQLEPMQARLDVRPLAEEVAGVIVAGREDERLKWQEDGSVKVLVGKVLPKGSAARETLAARRKRFRLALTERLAEEGWVEAGMNVFRRLGSNSERR
jgi:hypothetical protein